MYAVTKTYKDFNGVERTETKLFNLTETEVMEMELGTAGGVAEMLQRIVDAKDQPTIIKFFKEFILKAYGEKSADGTYFEKSEEISRKFAVSAKLGGVAAIVAIIIGVILGSIAALTRNKLPDRLIVFFTTLGTAMPSFVLATLLLLVFCLKLGWIPVWSSSNPNYLLPIIALAAYPMAYITRLTKTSMLDALNQDYIRTARAKGLKEKVVIYSHAWRNALLPVITLIISWFMSIFMGSIVIEQIFQLNGIGKMYYVGLMNQDYDMALAVNMLYCIITLLSNLITDLSYGLVDPRVRIDK